MKERNNILREICTRAWMMVKNYGMSLADAMRQSWLIAKLKKAMKTRIVKFVYEKVTTGERRTAWGTLSDAIVPPTLGTGRKPNETLVTYWDTEKQAFRSFKAVNLLSIA